MKTRTVLVFTAGLAAGVIGTVFVGPRVQRVPDSPAVLESIADAPLESKKAPSSELPLESKVESWLASYRDAVEAKNVPAVAEMLQLRGSQVAALERALERQRDLVVEFSDLAVESISPTKAVAHYRRTDSFYPPRGSRVTLSEPIVQHFAAQNGSLVLDRASSS